MAAKNAGQAAKEASKEAEQLAQAKAKAQQKTDYKKRKAEEVGSDDEDQKAAKRLQQPNMVTSLQSPHAMDLQKSALQIYQGLYEATHKNTSSSSTTKLSGHGTALET